MKRRIFTHTLSIVFIVLLLSFAVATDVLYSHFTAVSTRQLKAELTLAAQGVALSGVAYLDAVADGPYRLTWVSRDGTVLYDTNTDEAAMDNHLEREEIREAFAVGKGSASRQSNTLSENTLYEAVCLADGTVLRISVNRAAVWTLLIGMLPALLGILTVSIVLALILADNMSNSIVKPLLSLDLEHPADNDTYEELSPVLTELCNQHRQIKGQMLELSEKNNEFSQILSSMSEGLVMLNTQGVVISMNRAARQIFGVRDQAEGTDFLTLDSSPELHHAIDTVKIDAHAEAVLSKNGREYQFKISRIASEGKTIGTLILGFDITEKAFAERNRQEFTANVS